MRIDGRARLAAAVPALLWTAGACAEFDFTPYGSAQGEYDSNVFVLASAAQAQARNGDPARGDFVQRYLAGLDGSYRWSGQRLGGTIEGRHFTYDRFSQLDHNEYLGAADFASMLGRDFDLAAHYRFERRMASFAERDSTQLTIERERNAGALAGLALGLHWRVEADVGTRDLASPLSRAAGFGVREDSAGLALKYRVVETLDAGLHASFLRGEFRDVPPANPCPVAALAKPLPVAPVAPAAPIPIAAPNGCAPAGTPNLPLLKFEQSTLELTTRYLVDKLSNLDAALGYTRRQDVSPAGPVLTAITGKLGYVRELTGKTAARVEVFRRVNSFVAGGNSVIGSGASGGLTWTPTLDLALDLDLNWTGGDFRGPGTGAKRSDHSQGAALQARWQVLRWFVLHPYARVQQRNSSEDARDYTQGIFGIEVLLRFGVPGIKPLGLPADEVRVVPVWTGSAGALAIA